MKSKILFILLMISCLGWSQSVPNTNTFSLQDVVNVVGGTSLQAAFTNSVDSYFDFTYKGDKDRLSNFRNYTIPSNTPIVSTTTATDITVSTATSGGNITSQGDSPISQRGVCWGTNENPDTLNLHTNNHAGTGTYSSYLTGLTCGTTYHYRAYAVNENGYVGYGEDKYFTASSDNYTLYFCAVDSIHTNCTNGSYDLDGTYSEAVKACSDFKNSCVTGYISYAVRIHNLSVGETLFYNISPCNSFNFTGYYVLNPLSETPYIIGLDSGVITSIETCP